VNILFKQMAETDEVITIRTNTNNSNKQRFFYVDCCIIRIANCHLNMGEFTQQYVESITGYTSYKIFVFIILGCIFGYFAREIDNKYE